MPHIHTFKTGDEITVDPANTRVPDAVIGRVFTVLSTHGKTVQAAPDDGVGNGLDYSAGLLVPATEATTGAAAWQTYKAAQAAEALDPGTIVTLKEDWGGYTATDPFVVLKTSAKSVSIALLGGEDGKAVRSPRSGLVVRDLAWLRETVEVA